MSILSDNELANVSGGAFYEGPLKSYTVQFGETVEKIAAKFGIRPLVLQELNPAFINEKMEVKPGTVLQVPDLPMAKK